jgi:hypothetical protein
MRAFTLTDEIRHLAEIKGYNAKRFFINIDYQCFGRNKNEKSGISA